MKQGVALSVVLALGLAVPAAAQGGADKARLDEFALPADAAGPRIEQLGERAASLAPPASPRGDRELAIPGLPAADRAPVAQLSQSGQTTPTQQLSESGQSRTLASGSVSSPDDSRPRASAPLGGRDRCDPQLGTEQLERCLQVLETRAAEFSAPEAPRLSAEQVLLAERGSGDERLASRSADSRLRLAAGDPDAEIGSNQELASIYLDRTQAQAPPASTEGPDALDAAGLAEVLQGLQIDVSGSGAR